MLQTTIIIPVYNAEKYLRRCLDSIASQTIKDFEVIIVDDGSTDNSGQIANEFAVSDHRFRVIHQSNGGVSSARNTGLNRAAGKWICFLDADDEFPATALAAFHERYYEDAFDFYIGGYVLLDEHGDFRYGVPERVQYKLSRIESIRLMYEPIHYQYLGYIAGKLFKRSIIEEFGIRFQQDVYFNEDRLFSTQYMCHCDLVCFFTEPVYRYFENSDSAMSMLFKQFNVRFFTDLDAMILMKESISTYSPENLQYARQGITHSYWVIQDMMNHFHANTAARLFTLHRKLWKHLPFKNYCRFILMPLADKVLHKIKNLFLQTEGTI